MKILIPLMLVFTAFFLLQSCSPDELSGKSYVGFSINGGPIQQGGCSRAAGGVQPYCYTGGSGCRDAYDCLGMAYANTGVNYPVTYRQALDTFYNYYYADQSDLFIERYDPAYYFSGLNWDRPDAVTKLNTGEYKFAVASGDSSILVIKAPFDSITARNVVFVVQRENANIASD